MNFKTAHLCDQFSKEVQVAEPLLRNFGGTTTFGGRIATIDVFEDTSLVEQTVSTSGEAQVLVIDGGASMRRALIDERIARKAYENGWAGIVVHGCVRDTAALSQISLGIKALGAVPLSGQQLGRGSRNRPLHFAGIGFRPGHYLYADADGVIVAPRDLLEALRKQEAAP